MRGIAVGGVAFNIPQTFDEFFNCMRAIVRKLPKEQQSEDDTRTLDILWHTEVRHRLAHLLHLPGHTKGGDGEIPERVRQEAWAWAASPTFSPNFHRAGAAQEKSWRVAGALTACGIPTEKLAAAMALVGLQSHESVLLTAAQPARNAAVVRADIVPDTQPKHHPL